MIDNKTIETRVDNFLDNMLVSPSAIKMFEDCKAGFIYQKILLPRIETSLSTDITNTGSVFHNLAEIDFNKKKTDEMMAYESKETKEAISSFKSILEKRPYYQYEASNEEDTRAPVGNIGHIRGIMDRLCFLPDDHYLIVDYKTSYFTYVDTDIRQLMTYAYMLWKTKGIDAEKISIALDYVRADQFFRYDLVLPDLERHENYLKSRLKLIKKTLLAFRDKKDIYGITHTPGNCNLCPMYGKCVAFSIMINPHPDVKDPEELSTIDLIDERIKLSEIENISKARLSAVKQALMMRYESNAVDKGDPDKRPHKEIIDDYMMPKQQKVKEIDTRKYLQKTIPIRAKKLLKRIPFAEFVDIQLLERIVSEIVSDHLPRKLPISKIPEDMKKKLEKDIETKNRAPYLQIK